MPSGICSPRRLKMDEKDLKRIQEQIGYQFKNPALLKQAFTRSSYAKENGGEDNEVLEFLGDNVLDFIVAKKLARFYGKRKKGVFSSDKREGELSSIKRALVSRHKLAHKINLLDFHKCLIMGNGDKTINVQDEDSVKEDLFEAILGAVAIDSGWSVKALERVTQNLLDIDYFLEDGNEEYNFVDSVQRWAQKVCGVVPKYEYEENEDYQLSTDYDDYLQFYHHGTPRFVCRLTLPDIDRAFEGDGDTKSEARQMAANEAYIFLSHHNLFPSMRDEIGEPSLEFAINQLQQLAQKGFINMPEYNFKERHDKNGNPVWLCECGVYKYGIFVGENNKKTEAKKTAAFETLRYILNADSK